MSELARFIFVATAAASSVCVSAAASDIHYRKIELDGGKLCIDSHLPVEEMKREGILGSELGSSVRGIFVTYPSASGGELTIFVRPAGQDERPLPTVPEDQLRPVQGIEDLSTTPIDSRKAQRFVAKEEVSTTVGRFVATCRDLPIPRQCSRPFRHPGLVGTYSFKREQLGDWKNLERALDQALTSKEVVNCSDIK